MSSRRGVSPIQVLVAVTLVLVCVCCVIFLTQARARHQAEVAKWQKEKADFVGDVRGVTKGLETYLAGNFSFENSNRADDLIKGVFVQLHAKYDGTPWEKEGFIIAKLENARQSAFMAQSGRTGMEMASRLNIAHNLTMADVEKSRAIAQKWIAEAKAETAKTEAKPGP